jgi:glutamate racemase
MFIGIDALILGCTHYPLIKKEVEEFFHNNKIEILATNEIIGRYVKNTIEEKSLNRIGNGGKHKFYVSDYTDNFAKATKLFYGESVDLVKLQITKE